MASLGTIIGYIGLQPDESLREILYMLVDKIEQLERELKNKEERS